MPTTDFLSISPTERPVGRCRWDSRCKRPRDAEADIGAQLVFGVVVAGGRTGALWKPPHDPGTATNDMVDAIASIQSRAVRRRFIVIALIAILDPFPNVAIHVVQAERIGRNRGDWCGFWVLFIICPMAAATAAICVSVSDLVAPRVGGVRTGACRVLPFGLREKPVGLASHL